MLVVRLSVYFWSIVYQISKSIHTPALVGIKVISMLNPTDAGLCLEIVQDAVKLQFYVVLEMLEQFLLYNRILSCISKKFGPILGAYESTKNLTPFSKMRSVLPQVLIPPHTITVPP